MLELWRSIFFLSEFIYCRKWWNPYQTGNASIIWLFEDIFSKNVWQKFEDQKNFFFKNKNFEQSHISEVYKNKISWQSGHALCLQTTVIRSRKFAKNEAFRDILWWVQSYADTGHSKFVLGVRDLKTLFSNICMSEGDPGIFSHFLERFSECTRLAKLLRFVDFSSFSANGGVKNWWKLLLFVFSKRTRRCGSLSGPHSI